MLYRKMTEIIEKHLEAHPGSILVLEGLSGTGKTSIVREVGQKMFKHYIEIDYEKDRNENKQFTGISKTEEFYHALEMYTKKPLSENNDTLVFFDNLTVYPKLGFLLKKLIRENRCTYILSGNDLKQYSALPQDRMHYVTIRPMDFTEYLLANGIEKNTLDTMYENYTNHVSLDEDLHAKIIKMFNDYIIVGGMPEVVNAYITNKDLNEVRRKQNDIREFYARKLNSYGNHVPVVSDVTYPLHEDENLDERVYFNDVGMMTSVMEFTGISEEEYEDVAYATFIVTEAVSHGVQLYNYRDSDILLLHDKNTNTVLPLIPDCSYTDAAELLEVVKTLENVQNIIVLSANREIRKEDNVTYMPVYDVMYLFRNI